jgi:hypothetical protein
LNYLREGPDWEPPEEKSLLNRLKREFVYYGIHVPQLKSTIPDVSSQKFELNLCLGAAKLSSPSNPSFGRGYEMTVLKSFMLESVETKITASSNATIVLSDANGRFLKSTTVQPSNRGPHWHIGTLNYKITEGKYHLLCFPDQGSQFFYDIGDFSARQVGQHLSIISESSSGQDRLQISANPWSVAFILNCLE